MPLSCKTTTFIVGYFDVNVDVVLGRKGSKKKNTIIASQIVTLARKRKRKRKRASERVTTVVLVVPSNSVCGASFGKIRYLTTSITSVGV